MTPGSRMGFSTEIGAGFHLVSPPLMAPGPTFIQDTLKEIN